jgi:hypothetical protein
MALEARDQDHDLATVLQDQFERLPLYHSDGGISIKQVFELAINVLERWDITVVILMRL